MEGNQLKKSRVFCGYNQVRVWNFRWIFKENARRFCCL